MTSAMTIPQYDQIVLNVPHVDIKRFLSIAKVFGCTIEKRCELDMAIAEVEAGKAIRCSSLDELKKLVG